MNITWRDNSGVWVTLGAAGLVALTAAFMATHAGGYDTLRDIDDLCQGTAAGLAALVAAVTSRRHAGRARQGWRVMAFGLAMWAAGQGVWCWYEVIRQRPCPFPSPADIGFLSFSGAATVAVWLMSGEGHAAGRLRAVVDGLIVAGALLAVSWATALGAAVSGGTSSFTMVVAVAYPVGDIVLLTMTVHMLARVGGARPSLVLLGAGTIGLALADSSFTYLSAIGHYRTGDPLDLGWIAGFGLIAVAAAAARPERRRVAGTTEAAGPVRAEDVGAVAIGAAPTRTQMIFLPYAVLLAAASIMAGLVIAGRHLDPVDSVAGGVTIVLVLLRQYLILRENQDLVRTVEARESQLAHQAFHDDLTGLPNRVLLHDRLAHALERQHDHGAPVALLFCDLDDFKMINDSLGHRAGDELLVRVAERMRGALRPSDTLARLGGDEFAVLVEGADAEELGRRILDSLREPFTLGRRRAIVRASIGVSEVGAGERIPSASIMLSKADTAMYAAKSDGKGGLRRYELSMQLTGLEEIDLQGPLTEALAHGGICAAYQPVVDPHTGRVETVEALARWARPEGQVSPAVFVPLAERIGLVHALTDVMLEQALADRARWAVAVGSGTLRVAVNVSALDLTAEASLVERVAAALDRHGVPADQLIVEVTESVVASDDDVASRTLAELRALGVRVAIDDFGTGLSSLGRLQKFPHDVLKLDAALTRDVGSSQVQAVIVRSIVDLGRRLGMAVVAEGVETTAQLAALRSLHPAPHLQGFGLARPMPPDDLLALLRAGTDLVAAAGARPTPACQTARAQPAFPALPALTVTTGATTL